MDIQTTGPGKATAINRTGSIPMQNLGQAPNLMTVPKGLGQGSQANMIPMQKNPNPGNLPPNLSMQQNRGNLPPPPVNQPLGQQQGFPGQLPMGLPNMPNLPMPNMQNMGNPQNMPFMPPGNIPPGLMNPNVRPPTTNQMGLPQQMPGQNIPRPPGNNPHNN